MSEMDAGSWQSEIHGTTSVLSVPSEDPAKFTFSDNGVTININKSLHENDVSFGVSKWNGCGYPGLLFSFYYLFPFTIFQNPHQFALF